VDFYYIIKKRRKKMTDNKKNEKWLTTDYPQIVFENSQVGRVKKEEFDAPMNKIEGKLKENEVPSPTELGKAGS